MGASIEDGGRANRIYSAIGLVLLTIVAVMDATRPFNLIWSNLYYGVLVYLCVFVRGRATFVLLGLIFLAAILVPIICFDHNPSKRWGLSFHRVTGVCVALLTVMIILDRRRIIGKLEQKRAQLESKVEERTVELRASNENLLKQNAALEATQAKLLVSRNQLEAVSRQLIDTIETERRHVAHELHDEIGQILTAIKICLRRLSSSPDVDSVVSDCEAMINIGICRVRDLARHLRPPQLDELGLVAALHGLVNQQAELGQFRGSISANLGETRLPRDLEIVSFRIVQESLTNACRHAKAQNVRVSISRDAESLDIQVEDDGAGFRVDDVLSDGSQNPGIGLLSMRERVNLVRGKIDIRSALGTGTTVRCTIPLEDLQAT